MLKRNTHNRILFLVSALLFVMMVFTIRCDHGLGLLESRITGHLYYLNVDKRPDYVESVRVVALVQVPPQSLGDVVYTARGVGFRSQEATYELPAPLTTYVMVAAIWRQKGKDWDYGNILGIYGFDPINYTFEITPVTLDKAHPVAEGIDIYCDWGLIAPKAR